MLCTAVAAVGLTFTACSGGGGGGGGDSAAVGDNSPSGLAPSSLTPGQTVVIQYRYAAGDTSGHSCTLQITGANTATWVGANERSTVTYSYSSNANSANLSYTLPGQRYTIKYSFDLSFTGSAKGNIVGGRGTQTNSSGSEQSYPIGSGKFEIRG